MNPTDRLKLHERKPRPERIFDKSAIAVQCPKMRRLSQLAHRTQ